MSFPSRFPLPDYMQTHMSILKVYFVIWYISNVLLSWKWSDCHQLLRASLTRDPSDTVLFAQDDYFYSHLSAVFEWMLSVNLELFELSYAVEFCFFSSFMISNLLSKRDEEKPLMMSWYEAARVQLKHRSSEDGLSKTSVRTVAGSWPEDQ